MTTADRIDRHLSKLLVVEAEGEIRHLPRAALASLFRPGDLVVANDAATLPASLQGVHRPSGETIEARLAAWVAFRDPARFVAIAFGAGDHRAPTEGRSPPPPLAAGDRLAFGPLDATVERLLDHPRLLRLRFAGAQASVLQGLARHGRPIHYAHVAEPLALWDVWTKIAAEPIAFEPPSAGFALDWRMLEIWRARGVAFATLSHAAGLSSTGDAALDRRLPFDEFYRIPDACASAVQAAKSKSGRVVAIGTSVVRALESAETGDGSVRPGEGLASGRIGRGAKLRVVDAILTGVHQPGESHFELLRAFAGDGVLDRMRAEAAERFYRAHEFGDSVLIERQAVA
ncbi:MAG TPA: S-adenosylmethionine:tRNA ribosyltransferase-isomerase [Roseiarcus sp.]|nr:S-adenosylmethionine:tRNA ribosyltransferase-isomerase [Roseiarcus sp.]